MSVNPFSRQYVGSRVVSASPIRRNLLLAALVLGSLILLASYAGGQKVPFDVRKYSEICGAVPTGAHPLSINIAMSTADSLHPSCTFEQLMPHIISTEFLTGTQLRELLTNPNGYSHANIVYIDDASREAFLTYYHYRDGKYSLGFLKVASATRLFINPLRDACGEIRDENRLYKFNFASDGADRITTMTLEETCAP